MIVNGHTYYIEPLDEHVPNDLKHHAHIVYEPDSLNRSEKSASNTCGTKNWEDGWRQSFFKRFTSTDQPQIVVPRGMASVHRYLEILVVCDKKFVEYHKTKDIELYVLTIMNMVSSNSYADVFKIYNLILYIHK